MLDLMPLVHGEGDFDISAQRGIESHYHLQSIAHSAGQLVRYQAASLQVQASRMRQAAAHYQITETLLSDIESGVEQIITSTQDTHREVAVLHASLREGLTNIANQMLDQQRTLDVISEALLKPYETKAMELRREANKWLKSGMGRTGRDRGEDFNDAMRLLRTTVDNPIGNQDYVVWFQIGWLQWKHENSPGEAAESFYRASRLSSSDANLYHVESLRHLAYMKYLQKDMQGAYETVQALRPLDPSHLTLYDAARYASRTGRSEEALKPMPLK